MEKDQRGLPRRNNTLAGCLGEGRCKGKGMGIGGAKGESKGRARPKATHRERP